MKYNIYSYYVKFKLEKPEIKDKLKLLQIQETIRKLFPNKLNMRDKHIQRV